VSRTIRATCGKPVFLAGGLAATNVAAAVVKVGPFAVDVCSGVRTQGRLDPAKLHSFVAQVREASA
jgi:phosphoribosylanthranilate isomerase